MPQMPCPMRAVGTDPQNPICLTQKGRLQTMVFKQQSNNNQSTQPVPLLCNLFGSRSVLVVFSFCYGATPPPPFSQTGTVGGVELGGGGGGGCGTGGNAI